MSNVGRGSVSVVNETVAAVSEGGVVAAPPSGFPSKPMHPETGVAVGDFMPSDPSEAGQAVSERMPPEKVVRVHGDDFIPATKSKVLRRQMDLQVEKLAKELMDSYADKIAEYKEVCEKLKDTKGLSAEAVKTLRRKKAKGNPMSPQRARKLAEEKIYGGSSNG